MPKIIERIEGHYEVHEGPFTALCNDVGPGDLAHLNGTLEDVTYLPA